MNLDSNSYKAAWQAEREAAAIYGDRPYKGTPTDFAEYLRRRKQEDASRRPGGTVERQHKVRNSLRRLPT